MEETIKNILAAEKITREEYYIAIVDGRECQTLDSFLRDIGVAFRFPSYYGQNLDALNECLNDLEWIDKSNYLLVIKNAGKLLLKESKELRKKVAMLMENVSKEWANVPNYQGEEAYRKKADFRIKRL